MISVIIPVYNVEDYLHVCLNSVLKQTYQDFEIICIDDASTDSSLEILEYFTKKDSRIKILKNDSNKGPGFSRNRGLEIAQGKYISFLDGDDWFSQNTFEILVEKAEKDNLDLLMFKNIVYYEEPQEFGMEEYYDMEFMNKFEDKIFNHYDLDKTKLFVMSNAPWNKFYLKSFLDENNIRFPNENLIHEDNPFFYKVITSAKRISLINKYLHNRRRRPNSIMTLNNERLFDNIDICYLILDVFLENYQLYQYYKREVLTYIFRSILGCKYHQIEDQFKEDFFKQAQEVYRNFIVDYCLYEDILKYVDKSILDKFKFDEIVESINHKPKISVIVPVYNAESYIDRAFNSLLNQSIGFDNLEIIFVDDVSTDSSPDIIIDYSNKYENVKSIFLEENSGSGGKPRNIGRSYATADYLMYLDSDDIFMEDACEILYNEITSENIDLVSGVHSWDGLKPSEGLWLSILTDPNENYQIRQDKVNDLLSNEFPFKINSIDDWESIIGDFAFQPKIYKKSFIEEKHINFAEGIIAEDSVFVCNVLLNANGIKYIDKIVYLYYHDRTCDDPSMSQINSIKILKGLIDAFHMMYELSLNKNKSEIFKHYLLFQKLEYFICRLLNADLSIKDVLEVLSYSTPLFKIYVDYNNEINSNFSDLFKFIADEDYENALVFMFGENIKENDDFKDMLLK